MNTIPGPPPGPRHAFLAGVPTGLDHGRRRGRPRRPADRRTSRALRRGSRRLCACSRFYLSIRDACPACPGRGPARRSSHDLRHPGRPAGCDPHCRRSRARCTPGPPHRPRSHRATARGERPRRPRPSRSGRGAGFRGRGRRRGRGSAWLPSRRSAGWMRGAPPQSRPRGYPIPTHQSMAQLFRVLARAGLSPPRQVLDDEEVSVRALAAAILFEREARAQSGARRGRTRRIRRFERSGTARSPSPALREHGILRWPGSAS